MLRTKQFSTTAGGVALGIMMIPIAVRNTETFLRAVPVSPPEARSRIIFKMPRKEKIRCAIL